VQSPSGIEGFFEHMRLLAKAGSPDLEKIKELADKYEIGVSVAIGITLCVMSEPVKSPAERKNNISKERIMSSQSKTLADFPSTIPPGRPSPDLWLQDPTPIMLLIWGRNEDPC
jgi:hypothetical protein